SSALEIARDAGWDETVNEIETRVITAIASLEEAGYLLRKQNRALGYADSILARTAQEAGDSIEAYTIIPAKDKPNALRIMKSLIASKRRSMLTEDEGEPRTDYLADTLGIPHGVVIQITREMRQESILADTKGLRAYIDRGDDGTKPLKTVRQPR